MSEETLIPAHPSGLTREEISTLMQEARAVAKNAYAPYSSFKVGAAMLLTNGETVTGCNVENASYRLTSCAEQSAIASAVAQFGPKIRIRAVGVANLNPHVACMPCGACRQTIEEFATDECWVFYPAQDGCPSQARFRDLLPESFRLAH